MQFGSGKFVPIVRNRYVGWTCVAGSNDAPLSNRNSCLVPLSAKSDSK